MKFCQSYNTGLQYVIIILHLSTKTITFAVQNQLQWKQKQYLRKDLNRPV